MKQDYEEELSNTISKEDFAKISRELKTLYDQNQDLFANNKEIKTELKESEERSRMMVNLIKKYPEVMHDVNNNDE